MNILTLNPKRHVLSVAWFQDDLQAPVLSWDINGYRDKSDEGETAFAVGGEILKQIGQTAKVLLTLDGIGLRVPYGGMVFREPIMADPDVLATLTDISDQAPVHLPSILNLVCHLQDDFPGVPVILAFETSFFVDLPEREYAYALDCGAAELPSVRRYGFHGLYHEAACAHMIHKWRRTGGRGQPRTLSVCLEPRPRAAAPPLRRRCR